MNRTLTIPGEKELLLPNSTVGISVSGGADSALLLFLMLSQTQLPIQLFSVVSGWLDDCEIEVTKNIIDYMNREFPGRIIGQYIDCSKDPEHMEKILFRRPIQCLYRDQTIKAFMNGATKTPTIEEQSHPPFGHVINDSIMNKRSPDILHPIKLGPGWYVPLKNLNKKDIAELYHQHNIMDLFDLTRSCVVSPQHCGHCWWCAEREWAFGRL